MPLVIRLFESLPLIVLGVGLLFSLLAVALTRRAAVRVVWAAWLLGPVALTFALAAWVALWLTPGAISLQRWLLAFALTLAVPAAAAAFAATRLAMMKLASHVLSTLVAFAVAYEVGAIAAGHVVQLIETVQ
ncbi:MAG TPA: hypothetical protein VFT57_16520 [Gemmatimonadaceae bacterium]|jgi:hypothetical protein|nr:hypothetical protein [Gemmatimonadaceae bacterium]